MWSNAHKRCVVVSNVLGIARVGVGLKWRYTSNDRAGDVVFLMASPLTFFQSVLSFLFRELDC